MKKNRSRSRRSDADEKPWRLTKKDDSPQISREDIKAIVDVVRLLLPATPAKASRNDRSRSRVAGPHVSRGQGNSRESADAFHAHETDSAGCGQKCVWSLRLPTAKSGREQPAGGDLSAGTPTSQLLLAA
eukprot:scaffold803_cov310-Pinguiococcus_pyrenoidosus.AAC.117